MVSPPFEIGICRSPLWSSPVGDYSLLHDLCLYTSAHELDMSHREKIRTRVLVLSDTHSALPDNWPNLPFSQPFPPADVAIHAGDLTSTGKLQEHERAVALIKSLPAPLKIVIPGNHDLTLDSAYCSNHPLLYGWRRPHTQDDLACAKDLYTNDEAHKAGIVYVVEGIHTFTLLNGAKLTVWVSAFTPEFCGWAFAYSRDTDLFNVTEEHKPDHPVRAYDFNASNDPDGASPIAIMITHGPPKGILDKTVRGEDVGCDHLKTAVERCKPLLHCFGHIHEGWGSSRLPWQWKHELSLQIGLLEKAIQKDDEVAQAEKRTGNRLSKHNELREDRKSTINKLKDSYQQYLRYVEEEDIILETRNEDSVMITDEEQKSVEYIDATKIKHGLETVFVNASIMDVQYRPVQKPWVVDLALPSTIAKAVN